MKLPVLLFSAGLLLLGPQADSEAPPAAGEGPDDRTAAAQQTPAAPGPERSGKRTEKLESFAPTERLPADSAISFPVDI